MNPRFFSYPTSSFGYYRGISQAGDGQDVNYGVGQFGQGQGPVNSTSQWSPTILYMFALIIVEMVVFGFLSKQI